MCVCVFVWLHDVHLFMLNNQADSGDTLSTQLSRFRKLVSFEEVSTPMAVITSDQDACWPTGLVEEAAVDGQEGPAHDTAGGRADPGDL